MKSSELLLACVIALAAPLAHADTLLIDRAAAGKGMNLPQRGLSMAQVQSRFGTPGQKLGAVGGGSQHTPPISRWNYGTFTVYFENDHVVDAVLTKAGPDEIGPAPARP